jgi:hypothetical protein
MTGRDMDHAQLMETGHNFLQRILARAVEVEAAQQLPPDQPP